MHLNKTELNAANSNSGSWVDRIIAYESALAEGATPAPSSSGDLPKEDQERLDYGCKAVNALQQAFQNQPEPEAESAPQTLGDFRIIREIGRGGMGTVYEAQQLSMGRSVALKVLPFAAIVDGKALKRFRNEVRTAAALDHPHIVSVYSIGEERGIHYFSMQLIRGQSLADLILQTRSEVAALQGKEVVRASARNGLGNEELTIDSDVAASRSTIREEQSQVNTAPRSRRDSKRYRAAAQLGIETADALQHAHDQGVLHRDIKPSNLLLDAEGSLYVADFGLARIEAEAGLTLTGDIIGTLRYMAPEQALANRVVIDHRADIYSLGATLYELLTLQPAFDSADRSDLLRQIAFEEPMPLRRRDPRIALELETIVLKAMARSPEERYSTAQELTDDLQAYLDNRPIKARRPNLLEKAVKWSRRHQAAVIAAAGCLALLACVASAAAIAIEGKRQEAEKHRQHAIQERDESYYRQYVAQMRQGQQDWENGKTSRLLQTLAEHLPTEARADFRGWEWYYLLSLCDTAKHTIEVGDGYASHVSVSPDGKYVLTSGAEVKLWELPSWKLIREFRGHIGPVYDVCWSPDGSRIASAGKDSTVRIWEPFTGRQLQKLPGRRDVPCVKWSPHGSWIATSTDATHVQLQNVDSGEAGPTLDYGGYVYDIAWSPGGKKVAVVGGGQGGTRVWRADTGELISTLPSQPHDKFDVAWSPDGRWLANTTYGYARVQVWDTQSGELAQLLHGHQGGVNCIAWSDDGSQLASGGRDESVVVWNAKTGEQTNTLRDHTGWVRSLDWLPNGKSLISADASGEIRVWDLSKAGNPRQISIAEGDDNIDRGRIWSWSKDSTGFLSLDRKSGEIEKLDALSGRKVSVLEGNVGRVSACVWNASGDGLATASSKDNVIDIWRVDPKHSVVHRAALRVRNGEQPLALCPDSRYVTTSCAGDDSAVWDVDSERELFRIPTTNPRSAAWSPAGNVLALAEESTLLSLWEVPSGRHLSSLSAGRWKLSIAWSADGRQLAAGGFRQRVDTWDVASGNVILKMDGHHGRVSGVAWSPDGSRIASNGYGQVKFWDAATGEEVLSVESDVTGQLYWSPDGRSLAGTRFGGSTLVVFDASRGYQVANRLKPNAATKIPTALRPEFPGNWVTRANFLLENHRPQEYLDLCRYLVASADVFRSPDAVRALSRTCALAPNALDDYRVPISAARRVSAENPEDATLIIYLAALLYRSGDWEGAHRLLLAEQSNLNDAAAGDQALAWCWLAMTEYRLNDGSAAEDHLEKVSEMEIDDLSPEVGVVVSRLRNEASALIRGDD